MRDKVAVSAGTVFEDRASVPRHLSPVVAGFVGELTGVGPVGGRTASADARPFSPMEPSVSSSSSGAGSARHGLLAAAADGAGHTVHAPTASVVRPPRGPKPAPAARGATPVTAVPRPVAAPSAPAPGPMAGAAGAGTACEPLGVTAPLAIVQSSGQSVGHVVGVGSRRWVSVPSGPGVFPVTGRGVAPSAVATWSAGTRLPVVPAESPTGALTGPAGGVPVPAGGGGGCAAVRPVDGRTAAAAGAARFTGAVSPVDEPRALLSDDRGPRRPG